MLLAAGLACTVQAQDFDDIYYNPSTEKAKQERRQQKAELKARQYHAAEDSPYDYAPAGDFNYTSGAGVPMSIDEYNRRGIFAAGDSTTAVAPDSATAAYTYTSRIKRFHNPDVVAFNDPIAEYLESPTANVNIIVNNPGYYGYWGSPYWSSYAYDPFWDPMWGWSLAWGPSWSWGWGPAWSWRPSWSWGWGWGPSWSWGWGGWGPSWGWGGGWSPAPPMHGAPHRPGFYTSNPRRNNHGGIPSTGQRPGAPNTHRPTADGYRPGSGIYPGYQNNGQGGLRPGSATGTGTYRPGVSSGSYSRPGTSSGSNSGSYTRPGRGGNSRNSGSSYRSSGSSNRSTGGSFGGGGGSRSGGGGSSRGGGGSHGGRH